MIDKHENGHQERKKGGTGATFNDEATKPYLMELRKIFVRKLLATCTSFSEGIFCVTISTIFIFLGSRGRNTHKHTLRAHQKFNWTHRRRRETEHVVCELNFTTVCCQKSLSGQRFSKSPLIQTNHNSVVVPRREICSFRESADRWCYSSLPWSNWGMITMEQNLERDEKHDRKLL